MRFYDFINTYFVLNVTAYPKAENLGFVSRILEPLHSLGENLAISPVLFILGFLRNNHFAATKIFTEKRFFSRISVPFVCCLRAVYNLLRNKILQLLFHPDVRIHGLYFYRCGIICSIKSHKKQIRDNCCYSLRCNHSVDNSRIEFFSIFLQDLLREGQKKTVQSKAAEYIGVHTIRTAKFSITTLWIREFILRRGRFPDSKTLNSRIFYMTDILENIDEQNRYIAEGQGRFCSHTAKQGVSFPIFTRKNIALKTDYTLVFSQEYSVAESALTDKKTIQTYYLFQTKEK